MKYIKLTKENIEKEHICCALSDRAQVMEKKTWLLQRMEEGLNFYRLQDKGKVFIEYLPVEAAWYPIEASHMMWIDCFWVSGKYKGQGYSRSLFQQCLDDAKQMGMHGIIAMASQKKKPYMNDASFLQHLGFSLCDEIGYFQLYYLPFHDHVEKPKFRHCAKTLTIKEKGFVLYYSSQCPFAIKYANILEQKLQNANIPVQIHHLASKQQAQSLSVPWSMYALFVDGQFQTHEILSEKKIDQWIDSYGKNQTD